MTLLILTININWTLSRWISSSLKINFKKLIIIANNLPISYGQLTSKDSTVSLTMHRTVSDLTRGSNINVIITSSSTASRVIVPGRFVPWLMKVISVGAKFVIILVNVTVNGKSLDVSQLSPVDDGVAKRKNYCYIILVSHSQTPSLLMIR